MNYRRILTIVVSTLIFVGIVTTASADGDVRYVAPSGSDTSDCINSAFPCATVQYAVDQADAGDEVRVAEGTYTGVNSRGGLSQIAYISKTVTIRGGYATTDWSVSDPKANPATLDAQGNGRGIYVTGNVTPTIEGLRITGGDATGLGGSDYNDMNDSGSGIYVTDATVTISGCVIFSNTLRSADYTIYGGGVFLRGDGATFVNNTVVSNTLSPVGSMTTRSYGGGVYLKGNNATLTNNIISTNDISASDNYFAAYAYGGGVSLAGDNVTFTQNEVTSNTLAVSLSTNSHEIRSYAYGAGVYASGSNVVLAHNLVAFNDAAPFCNYSFTYYHPKTYAYGGGIYAGSSVTLTHNTITFNTLSPQTTGGGGPKAYAYGAGVYGGGELRNNTIRSNVASATPNTTVVGGGAYNGSSYISNVIAANKADDGGGLYLSGGSPALTANVIVDNVATDAGGGLYVGASITLVNNVIANNQADVGDGVYARGDSTFLHDTISNNDGEGIHVADGDVDLTNTIIVNHTTGITVAGGESADLDHTLWHDNTADRGGPGTITHTNDYSGDPAFDTDGYHLMSDSAALDRGIDAGTDTDIDGNVRPQGPSFDLGADEFLPGCFVRLNGADYPSVQSAVDASTVPTDVIKVAGYCDLVNDRGGQSQIAYISKTVTIRGGYTVTNWTVSDPNANPTVLDARGNGRVLYITGQAITPTIEGLWITGGDATGLGGGPSGADAGGGVYINSATVVISHCTVTSNAVSKSVGVFRAYGYGGGIYQTGGAVSLLDNTISLNTISITNTTSGAGYPYALYSYTYGGGVYQRSGQISLVGNTILSNTASAFAICTYQYHHARQPYAYAYGGGLYLEGNAILVNNQVSANDVSSFASVPNHSGTNAWAYAYGGGVWAGSNVTLTNNTITSNTLFFSTDVARLGGDGRGYGGGIYLDSDDVTLVGNNVSRNTIQGSGRTPRGFGGGVSGNGGSTIAHNHVSSNTISCLSDIVSYNARAYVYGGGMYFGGSGVVLAHNTVEANLAYANSPSSFEYAYAGGIYLGDTGTLNGNVIFSNTASALYASNGGGVWANSDVTFTNNVIVANKADGIVDNGDGVYVSGDSVFLYNTIVNNDGDGVYVDGASYLTNTIIAGHLVGVAGASASTVTLDHTLLYSNTVDWSGPGSLWHTASIYGDPVFDSDGYHLTASSVAIDQGIDVGVANDIDGHPRPLGTAYDIGADEFGIVLTITKSAPAAVVGTPLTYTIVVSNTGQKVALGVVVTDAVPVGASYLSGGVESNGVVTWSGLTIDVGGVATATFTVTTCQTSLTNQWYWVVTSTEGVTTAWGATLVTSLISPTINADFDYSPAVIGISETVFFSDTTTTNGGSIVDWLWDFGDGDKGSGATTDHTYNTTGTYTVTLYVTDACGYMTSEEIINAVGVHVPHFTIGKENSLSPVVGNPFTYTLTVTNISTVDDATGVTVADVVPPGGHYVSGANESGGTVTLDVGAVPMNNGQASATWVVSTCQTTLTNQWYRVTTSDQGIGSDWGPALVTHLVEPIIDVSFNHDAPAITWTGETVYFTGTTTTNGGSIVDWLWDFGDGDVGNGATDGHIYIAGSYTVTLLVTDTCGYTATKVTVDAVTVIDPPAPAWETLVYVDGVPTSTFPVVVVAGDTVQIVDRVWVTYTANTTFTLNTHFGDSFTLTGWVSSTGSVTQTGHTLIWNVEDSASNAWHTITRTFTVLSGSWATDYVTETLWVEDANPQPVSRVLTFTRGCEPLTSVDFTWSPPEPQTGQTTVFTATRAPTYADDPISFEWDFDDGGTATGNPVYHTFISSTGTHTIVVTATNVCSLATTSHTVYITGTPFVPIYGVSLTPSSMASSGDPGGDVTYNLQITNTGNGADTFDLTLDGNAWATVVDPIVVNLPPSGTRNITVTVSVSGTAQCDDTDVVTITAMSQISPTTKDSSVLTTSANIVRGMEFYSSVIARSGDPGETVRYGGIYFRNTGNCTDTFTLTTSGHVWIVTLPVTNVHFGAGEFFNNVWVDVDIPLTAHNNDQDTTMLTATSSDGIVSATITFTTTAVLSQSCTALTNVSIVGASEGYPGIYTFATNYGPDGPVRATEPIVYLWDDGDTVSTTVRTLDVGAHTLVVTATNCGGAQVVDTHTITIEPARIYLPLVMRNYAGPMTRHELEDAPDTCPGHGIKVGNHLYQDDFDTLNDHDWYSFEAVAGQTYTIRTSELELRADTSIALYADDCTTILAESDDIAWPDDVASRIVWTAQSDGTYHVDARSYDWQVHGNDTGYTFGVRLGAAADTNPALESMPGVPVKPSPPARP